MKLMELLPDPMDVLDPLEQGDEDRHDGLDADRAHKEEMPRRLAPTGENRKKAQAIANKARMKAKSTEAPADETSHQFNLGGHFTSFLDRGGHG